MDAEACLSFRISKAVVIQRFVRGMIARKRMDSIRQSRQEEACHIYHVVLYDWLEHISRCDFEADRRIHPKTIHDMRLARSEVDLWVSSETDKLKAQYHGCEDYRSNPEYLSAMKSILATSIKLRSRLKLPRQKVYEYKSKLLYINNQVVEVFNEHEESMIDLVNKLHIEPPESEQWRMDLVENLIEFIQDDPDAKYLLDLVGREKYLLGRHRPMSSMAGLRLRIRNTFLRML